MSTIKAPQGIVWAFNPYYVEIEDSEHESLNITVGDYSIEISLYNSNAKVYISRLIQMLFDDPVNQARSVKGVIKVHTSEGVILKETEIFALWGGIEIGERFPTFTAYKTDDRQWVEQEIPYFINYPFTLDILMLKGMSYRIRKDYSAYSELTPVIEDELKTLIGGVDIPVDIQKRWVLRQDSDNSHGVFDYTFDYTFGIPAETAIITKIVPRTEQEGYYLRWIDRFGFVRYYLFDKGDKSFNTELSEYKKEYARPYGGMYYGGHNRYISVETEVTMKMCASNLSISNMLLVETIVSSSVVDLYVGVAKDGTQLWLPVSVGNGTFTYSTSHHPLQDFEITIKLPNRITQTL